MYDRNVKSERILTKFRVLDYEYICDRIAKFHNIALHTAVRHSGVQPTEHVRQCIC